MSDWSEQELELVRNIGPGRERAAEMLKAEPILARVDYFKPEGKWYMTEEIDMTSVQPVADLFQAVRLAMDKHWTNTRGSHRAHAWQQFTVVMLEPIHRYAHPVMLKASVI